MSATPSKEKNKRQHPSSEKKNFLQNVASKVFEYIPSLSKIFGKKPNVSVPNHEESDPEEGPPPKRMRLSPPMQDCNNDVNFTSSNPFGSLLHTPPGSTMRHDLNFPSSSNNVHEINNDIVVEKDRSVEISVIKELPKSMIAVETVTSTRKYLYEIHPKTKLTVTDGAIAKTSTRKQGYTKQIYFHRRLLNEPFYAEHANRAEKPECTIIQPFKEIKAYRGPEKGVNSREICVSARRVLDMLDDCVSSLPKANKVPQYVISSKRDTYASTNDRFSIASTKSHIHQELHLPSNAKFLTSKTKCRLPQIMASQSSKGFVPHPCIMRAKSDKLTTKITRTRRGVGIDMNETVTPVVLPSATLEINEQELPIIFLGKTPLTITPKSNKYILSSGDDHNSISPIQTLTIEGSASQPIVAKMFTFSQPASLSSQETEGNLIPPIGTSVSSKGQDNEKDSNSEQEEIKSSMKVEDGSNLSIKNNLISKNETENTAAPQNKTFETLANNIKYGVCRKCNDNIIDNDPGAEKYISPGTSKTNNSTMIIESPPANSGTTSSFKNIAESQKSNKWECSVCLVSNTNDSTKCACCCAERKPNTSTKDMPKFGGNNNNSSNTIESPPANSGTSCFFKDIVESQKSNKWECSVCLVSNTNDSTKCACCCAERKPNTSSKDMPNFGGNNNNSSNKIESPPVNSRINSFFKDIVESQNSDKWECSVCLVSNTNDSIKCACCCAERKSNTSSKDLPNFEGNNNNSNNKIESPPANSGSNSFKDIAESQKSNKWECSVCLVSNTNDSTKCACCCAERKANTSSKDMSNFGGNNNNSSYKIESPPANSGTSSSFKDIIERQKSYKWKCSVCLVTNTTDVNKCACCSTLRKSNTSSKDMFNFNNASAANPGTSSSFRDIYESQKCDSWACSDCFASNPNDSVKCVCCYAIRKSNTSSKDIIKFVTNNNNSSEKIEPPPANPGTSSSFKDIAESQKCDSWACSVCFVLNPLDTIKCACCYAPRKANTSSKDNDDRQMVNFGMNNNNSSPKIVSSLATPGTSSSLKHVSERLKNNKWTCPICLVSNLDDLTMCACCCAARKSDTNSKDTFNFGINTRNNFFDTDLKAKEAIAAKNPEPVTFKFGIWPDKSALNEGGSTTNSTEQNKMVEDNDQVQEVPSINLNQENTKAPLAGNVSSALPCLDSQRVVISGARIKSTSNSVSFQHAPVSLNAASTSISTTTSIVLPSSQSDSVKTLSVTAPTLIAPVATSSLITPAAGTVGTNQTQISTNATGNKSGPGLPTLVGEGFASGIFGTNSFGSNTASGESHSNTIFSFGGTHPNMGTSVPSTGLSVNNATVGDTPNSGNGTSSNSGLTVGSGPLGGNRLSVDNSNLFGNISVTPLHTLSDGSGSSMFGQMQKENIWTPSNNVTTPKKPTFVFGATSFNTNPSPAFSNVQSTPSVFGMDPNQSAQISNPGTVFPVPLQNPLGSNIFVTPSAPNQASEVNIFSAPAASAAPFGSPPAQPAAFNFGATANPVVFGFGQQQPQQSLQQPPPPPPQQPGVYNFSAGGGAAATAPQMQFRMGSAPTTAGRRMRKAVRRTTPR